MADVFGDLSLFSEFDKVREADGSFIHYGEDSERSRIIFEGLESESEDDSDTEHASNGCNEGDQLTTATVPVQSAEDEKDSGKTDQDQETTEENSKDAETNDISNSNGSSVKKTPSSTTLDDRKKLEAENEAVRSWLNEQLHAEAADEAKRSNISTSQLIFEKNRYRRFAKILDSTRYVPDDDSPAVQLLFSNNSFARKYRQQIEQFIKGLLWEEMQSGGRHHDGVPEIIAKPGAPSCIDMNSDLKPELKTERMRQKHVLIGGSQFHNKFLIDFLGWPFTVKEPPRCNVNWEIPLYGQVFNEVYADPSNKSKPQQKKRNKPACWNCGTENHSVADCRMPRNPARIAAKKREYMEQQKASGNEPKFTGASRYHLDPDIASKYSKFKPGHIGTSLRQALGLKDDQLPQYIYKMRLFGYPPGWLAEAKQIQSNVTIFDKNGRVTLITGECLEDGELDEDEEKDPTSEYDIKRIVEFPGFTVPIPMGFVDEHSMFNMPPIQQHQLKKTLMKQSTEKASSRKRKREAEQEEKNKAAASAKKLKQEEEGEVAEDDDKDENGKDTQEVDTPDVDTSGQYNLNRSSSSISISRDFGTPIMVRGFDSLPDSTKFGVGVEDHIPFENLPNSTGTFDKMKDLIDLIRKARAESDC